MADPFQYRNTGNSYNQPSEEKVLRKGAVFFDAKKLNLKFLIKT